MPVFKYQGRENFKVVPDGEYLLRIVDFSWDLSRGDKTAGADQLTLECDILDPKTGEQTGAKVWDRLLFTDKTGWRIDVFLKAIGKAPVVGTDMSIDRDYCQAHVQDAVAWGSITSEEYKGVTRNKVAAWITNKEIPKLAALVKPVEKGFE